MVSSPLENDLLAHDDAETVTLQTDIPYERRGVALAPGTH
jgi:hypothetical protein